MFSARSWSMVGAVLAAVAVGTGALAAHGLPDQLKAQYPEETVGKPTDIAGFEVPLAYKRLQDFKTAAEYQMYHALGLIAVGLLARERKRASLALAGFCFLLGILLFSGSLYAITLTGLTKLGMITPIGGLAFIVGWLALAAGACPCGDPGGRERLPS